MQYENRIDAGRHLAQALLDLTDRPNCLILALPRGGVPVAAEVAAILRLPYDALIVHKLGVPGHAELAMGALSTGGMTVRNPEVLKFFGIEAPIFAEVRRKGLAEIEHRNQLYRGGRKPPALKGKTVIVIDDGIATGATMRAAVQVVKAAGAGFVVAAAPIGAPDTCTAFAGEVDQLVCPHRPDLFYGVSRWYDDFTPTPDASVVALLKASHCSSA